MTSAHLPCARTGAAWDCVALAALTCISTWLLIGDFGVRLANTSTDDGVVGYALYFARPELFRLDAHMLNWAPVALASMMNWLPGVALKYAGISPELWYWLFVFLQNVLLGLAVFRFSTITTGSRAVAWLAALFVLAFRPHWWNIGLFADVDWMPYAGWLALPVLVYAAVFALEERVVPAALALLVGGLIHPIHGLFGLAMVGGYWLISGWRNGPDRRLALRLVILAGVAVTCLLPAVLAKSGVEEAPASLVLSLLLRNAHAVPWVGTGCSYCLPLFVRNVPLTLVVAALAVLAVRRLNLRPGTDLFIASSIAVTVTASALHVAAYFLQSISLLRVIGTRSSVLLLVYCTPLVIALAWRVLLNAQPALRMLAAWLITLPAPAVLLSALLLLVVPEGASSRPARALRLVCQALGAALFALVLARHVPKLGPRVDIYLLEPVLRADAIPLVFGYQTLQFPVYSLLVPALLALLVAAQVLARRRASAGAVPSSALAERAICGLLASIVAIYLLVWNQESGEFAATGEPREYFEVQAWARSTTAVNASFVVAHASVYEGWRNYTRRPAIAPHAICAVYLCPARAVERDEKMKEFYARMRKSSYIALDANGLREFSRAFGGDYAVRRKEWGPVDLPVAYQNDRYVVYDLR